MKRRFNFNRAVGRSVVLRRDHGTSSPGTVIVNGATGSIGSVVIQLCAILKLRAVAVARPRESGPGADFKKVTARLKELGAAEVLADEEIFVRSSRTIVSSPSQSWLWTAWLGKEFLF